MQIIYVFIFLFSIILNCKSVPKECNSELCLNGWQMVEYSNGDRFEGHFLNDEKQGIGIYYYANGDIFEGFYNRNLRSGEGIYRYQNGDKFEGQYNLGKRNGLGKYTFSDGSYFSGEWNENLFSGTVQLFNPKRSLVLEGTWQNNKFQSERFKKDSSDRFEVSNPQ